MKSKEEIEQLAESQYGTEIGRIRGSNHYDLEKDRKNGYIKGYTQCQSDMVEEIKLLKDYLSMAKHSYKLVNNERSGERVFIMLQRRASELYDRINSLNKQD
jgi:hypothetical protein